eukprot:CAMPEP_0201476268 /NCGR_PEP_ID=MMETSP0151_2-20130828/1503_1 /ASSEMBLY_ACC=CAM_ASM_000257 /TAXON_ID=200890 /ORGANISM="Paramoeba atlantica, Strain 621/1 / CCAP 1560/9" /LENGTH=1405 /DNA_ID=CAMNT_0047856583 /DNA_START=104 /DNA_END=4321 /DNA_ORIENTATION=-
MAEDDDDKNRLNPIPKGGKKVFSKPVKIGFLEVEEGGGLFKKKFKNKFCLLTDARELEWFRRQEDQVERKVEGCVKEMHLCTVDEYNKEYLGCDTCFSVKVNGKTYIFGAANAQERINWMVEILKLRTIQDIIALLNDPRLSRIAAYALCNQAGNKKGDIQTDIVTLGGVDGLISIVNECLLDDTVDAQSDDLLKSIYYGIQKLAENPKNKKRIGKHMVHFLDVLANENKPDYWRGFNAQCILKCLGNDTNIKLLKSVGGIQKIAKVFKGRAQDPLLKDVCTTLVLLAEDEENRIQVGKQLDVFVEVLGTTPDSAKILLMDLLMKLVESQEVLDDLLLHPQLVPAVIALLVSPNKAVQESLSAFLLFLSTHEVKKRDIQLPNGFINLISCACSDSPKAAETALKALESFLSNEENQYALGQLDTAHILRLISVLSKEVEEILSVAVSIFLIQSQNEHAKIGMGAREEELTQSLLEGLFRACSSPCSSISERAFVALANFSTLGLPQLQLCRQQHLSKIVGSFVAGEVTPQNNYSVVRIISYCSGFPLVVKEMGHCVKALCRLLEGGIAEIQERAASAIADFALSENFAEIVGESDGVAALTKILIPSQWDQLTVQALRAIANICFEAKYEPLSNPYLRIYAQLTHPSRPLAIRREAGRTLKNCTSTRRVELGQLELAQFVDVLKDGDKEVKACVCLAIANIFGASASEIIPKNVCENVNPQLLTALLDCVKAAAGKPKESREEDDEVLEHALFALTFVRGSGLEAVAKGVGIGFCVNLLESPNTYIGEQAASILENILSAGIPHAALYSDRIWEKFTTSFVSGSVKMMEKLCSTLQHCARQASTPDQRLKLNVALKTLNPLLGFPVQVIRKHVSEALIVASKDQKDGTIMLNDVGGVVSLMSFLTMGGVQIGQSGEWKIELEGAGGGFKLVPCKPGTNIRFTFDNEDQAREHLATAISRAIYNASFSKANSPLSSPSFSSFLTDEPETEQDDQEDPEPKRLASTFSIGGARVERVSSKKRNRGAGPSTPRAPVSRPPRAVRGEKVGSQYHLVALIEYLSLCDRRVGGNKRSVLSYLRAFRPKSRPPLGFQFAEGTEFPRRMEVDVGQENVQVEPPAMVQSSFQAIGPSGLYRTGLVRADKPLPIGLLHSSPISYFEVCIIGKCSPGVGTVGVGLCCGDAPRDQQVGWFQNSYGYHSDDGNKFFNGSNDSFGPQFGRYDVVGCGVDLVTNEIFFTKNGMLIGVAFEYPLGMDLYPCVALSGPQQKVVVNLGQIPFLFDFNFSSVLDFTPVPKAVPGGKVPDFLDDPLKDHPYLKTFDTLSRGWSFISTSITQSLSQFGMEIYHPPPQLHARPTAPLPPAFPSPPSLPNPFIGSARDVQGGDSGVRSGVRQGNQNFGRPPRIQAGRK